jgi:hypothetical protein
VNAQEALEVPVLVAELPLAELQAEFAAVMAGLGHADAEPLTADEARRFFLRQPLCR